MLRPPNFHRHPFVCAKVRSPPRQLLDNRTVCSRKRGMRIEDRQFLQSLTMPPESIPRNDRRQSRLPSIRIGSWPDQHHRLFRETRQKEARLAQVYLPALCCEDWQVSCPRQKLANSVRFQSRALRSCVSSGIACSSHQQESLIVRKTEIDCRLRRLHVRVSPGGRLGSNAYPIAATIRSVGGMNAGFQRTRRLRIFPMVGDRFRMSSVMHSGSSARVWRT